MAEPAGAPLWARILLCLGLVLAGCVQERPTGPEPPRILAMGDSIMAWNRTSGRSMADALERLTGREVVNRSVIGARILPAMSVVGLLKGPIGAQYVAGDWDWIVLSGGGNDLWWGCGCTRCDERIDELISADGQGGAIPRLAAKLRDGGAQVIWLGYPRVPGRFSPVDQCHAIMARFEARLARMAAREDGIVFLSNRDLVPRGDLSFHAPDRIHPSPRGSAAIAARVARVLRAEDA